MASLLIRDLRDDVKSKLRIRAAEHGRSMEAEARAVLTDALTTRRPGGLGTHIRGLFADIGGAELGIPVRDEPARALRLDR